MLPKKRGGNRLLMHFVSRQTLVFTSLLRTMKHIALIRYIRRCGVYVPC